MVPLVFVNGTTASCSRSPSSFLLSPSLLSRIEVVTSPTSTPAIDPQPTTSGLSRAVIIGAVVSVFAVLCAVVICTGFFCYLKHK